MRPGRGVCSPQPSTTIMPWTGARVTVQMPGLQLGGVCACNINDANNTNTVHIVSFLISCSTYTHDDHGLWAVMRPLTVTVTVSVELISQ